jgi:hypothetical protein
MPRKIVINRCYGGFGLSSEVKEMYLELTKDTPKIAHFYMDQDVRRDDPVLIEIIEKIGLQAAAGGFSKLKIIQIPDDVPSDGWTIMDYDGMEWVAEKHRIWVDETCDDPPQDPQPKQDPPADKVEDEPTKE